MIFSSKNEAGLPKWQFLLSLPIGGQFATRRFIKPEEKCVSCEYEKQNHRCCPEVGLPVWYCPLTDGAKYFFPSRFSLGKTFCVQAKRTGQALCGCGYGVNARDSVNNFIHGKDTHFYKQAAFKIVGGCWHSDWLKEFWVSDNEERRANMAAEAKLEDFSSVQGWLDWYLKHKIDINATWRVLAERMA